MDTLNFNLKRQRLYEALLILGFFLLCGFDLWHHVPWRDEMWPWLFARDSNSIPDLLHNLRYEPHSRLWYLVLYGVAHISHHVAAMQITNLLIIGSAITLFVRFCPLPFYIKALVTFGYLFVYEWGTLSRNYALGALMCFAFCSLFPRRKKGYLGLAAFLLVTAQANQFASLIAAALGGLLILEVYMYPEVRTRVMAHKTDATLSLVLIYGGVLMGFASGITPPDEHQIVFYSLSLDPNKFLHAFGAFWDGFLPFPEPTLLHAWSFGGIGHSAFGPLINHAIRGMILFPATVVFFRRSRMMLLTYLVGDCLLLTLAFVQTESYARHAGHFFLWFIICLWLAHYLPASNRSRRNEPMEEEKSRDGTPNLKAAGADAGHFALSRPQILIVIALFIIPIFDTVFSSIAGYCYPFSCAKEVATYLKESHLDKLPMVGYPDFAVMTISGYTGAPIYYADQPPRWGTFILENNKRRTDLTSEQLMQFVDGFAAKGNKDFIVVLNRPFADKKDGHFQLIRQVGNMSYLTSFFPCMVGDESYWIYRYKVSAS